MTETLSELLLELHQASRQYLRYLNIDQLRVAEALKRLEAATYAVTLHLERPQDGEDESCLSN